MYYIWDYIDYYKETCIENIKWNIMDNLILSMLVYLPVDGFKDKKNLEELSQYAETYKDEQFSGSMVPLAFNVLKSINGTKRYEKMVISDFQNERSNQAQFGAMTVRIGKITSVVYKGTDHSVIGWMENFRLAYDYPTATHKLAIEYMKRNINPFTDREVYVSGHSKGGNLAIVSAMEMEKRILKNIKKVYNFDGPGLRKEEFNGEKYKKIEPELVNIVPDGSIVGMLLYNKNYTVVETAPASINDHHPDTWKIFGQFFINGELSGISMRLHENTINNLESFTSDKAEETFETMFKSIEQEYTSDLNISPETVLSFIRNIKDVDEEITSNMYEIMKRLLW